MPTGVVSIDEQHKELIRHVNELHRVHQNGVGHDDIYKILRFLVKYAETHFRHEERVMEERACPLRLENQAAHAKFLRAFQELVSSFNLEADPDQIATEIEKMAARWLSSHICGVDAAGLRACPASGPKDGPKPAS